MFIDNGIVCLVYVHVGTCTISVVMYLVVFSTIYSLLILHIIKLHIAIYGSIVGLDRVFGLLQLLKKFLTELNVLHEKDTKKQLIHVFIQKDKLVNIKRTGSSIVLVRHVLFAVETNNS